MAEWRLIGVVTRLQLQREPLKASGAYRPDHLLPVERAIVGPEGMLGHHDGSWVVDAHHAAHPRSRGRGKRALSVGFAGHYAAIAERFGPVADGIAGENLIVDGPALHPEDLAGGLLVRRPKGEAYELRVLYPATPCCEFTSYLVGAPEVLGRSELQAELEFLDGGTRGYIVQVSHLGGPREIALGDAVLVRA